MDIEEQYDRIYRYCYHKVHTQQLAEDITQETFLRYFNQTTYLERGKPLAYLYTIARNLCNDYFSRKMTEPLDDIAAKKDIMDELVTSVALRKSISTLPEDVQELILLRYVNELSIGEICRIVNISRFTIYRKMKNGLNQLKTFLREEDFQ
jgi:RNA polymerase sigma-70 factor (ECF subfamily)